MWSAFFLFYAPSVDGGSALKIAKSFDKKKYNLTTIALYIVFLDNIDFPL